MSKIAASEAGVRMLCVHQDTMLIGTTTNSLLEMTISGCHDPPLKATVINPTPITQVCQRCNCSTVNVVVWICEVILFSIITNTHKRLILKLLFFRLFLFKYFLNHQKRKHTISLHEINSDIYDYTLRKIIQWRNY